MAKYVAQPIGTGFGAQSNLNQNFEEIEDNFQRVLYRDGSSPNQMEANIDMNGFTIYNAGSVSADSMTINGQLVVANQTFVTELPDPTGQGGKFIKSDGAAASWQPVLDTDLTLKGAVPIPVETVTAMQGLTGLVDKAIIFLSNFHDDTSGGGGFFYWDESLPSTSHDGGLVIAKNAVFPSDWTNVAQRATWLDGSSLTGSGCFVRLYQGPILITFYGVKGGTTINELNVVQKAIQTKKSVHFDVDSIYFGAVSGSLFFLDSTYEYLKYSGAPCRFIMDGDNTAAVNLFRLAGGHDIDIVDIVGEDTVNKAPTMTAQVGVDYVNVPDLGGAGTYRLNLIRPKMFGGRSLFTCVGVTNNTTANDVTIQDGHAEDTYYGVNCAESGYGLRAKYRCIRVKRAYFPYDVSNQVVDVYSENPGDSNAHFLLKCYDPNKGLRDIRLRALVKDDAVAGRGRLVFEHQDEATDLSKFSNIQVDFTDNRTLDSQSVFFRAFENPTTVRAVTNGTMENIIITGQCRGMNFISKPSSMANWDITYDAKSLDVYPAQYPETVEYYAIQNNETPLGVAIRTGVRSWMVAAEGVAGPGLSVDIPFELFNDNTGDHYYNLSCRFSAFQGATNNTSYMVPISVKRVAGVYTIFVGTRYGESYFGAGVIVFTAVVSGSSLRLTAAGLGGNQYGVFSFTVG